MWFLAFFNIYGRTFAIDGMFTLCKSPETASGYVNILQQIS